MDNKSLQSIIYEHLLAMVQNREFEFDKIYSETQMAKKFDVSRTPMRDALNRLASERYIDILPSRGFQLHKSTREDILEAYQIRCALERYCARRLAMDCHQRKAASIIEQMQKLNSEQVRMCSTQEMDLREFWNCDYKFHHCLIQHINNPSFYQLFDFYMHFFAAHNVSFYRTLSRDRTTVDEHQQLIDALRKGDADNAEACVQFHLDQNLTIISKIF